MFGLGGVAAQTEHHINHFSDRLLLLSYCSKIGRDLKFFTLADLYDGRLSIARLCIMIRASATTVQWTAILLLARRAISSVSWNFFSTLLKSAVLFARSILLARLLPVETFGVYGYAGSIVALTIVLANFGMEDAFYHRAPETEQEEPAAAVHFTLKLCFTLAWAVLLAGFGQIFLTGEVRIALLALVVLFGLNQLTQTPKIILIRRVVHRRLAILNLAYAVVNTIVAVGLAWRGYTLVALLSTDLIALLLNIFAMYIWKPFWKPRLLWDWERIKYYLRFGSRNIAAGLLLQGLNEVDDLFTGRALGSTALGFYSRVYAFASYPRMIIAQPMEAVSAGTYAELKGDRKRLSMAFFRFNALIVRINFLFAGGLFLVAYEFVLLVLGERWLPMTVPFQLMLIYTMLDPIKLTLGNLLTVIGHPEKVVRVRLVQFGVLIAGLFLLGPAFNIIGVTLAVDLMLLTGIVLLILQVREFVDFSLPRLFGAPTLALLAGLMAALLAARWPGLSDSIWLPAVIKAAVFGLIYLLVLFLMERRSILEMLNFAREARRQPALPPEDLP